MKDVTNYRHGWNPTDDVTDRRLYDYVCNKLKQLGYKIDKKPQEVGLLIKLLDRITAASTKKHWTIITSNDVQFLDDMAKVIPVTLALTFNYSVHPMSAEVLYEAVTLRGDEESELLPLGLNAIRLPAILMFREIDKAFKPMQEYIGKTSEYFRRWALPNVKLIATSSYPTTFEAAQKKFFSSLEFYYGAPASAAIKQFGEFIDYHVDELEKPARALRLKRD